MLVCVLLLAVIAFRPFAMPQSAHAANQYSYRAVYAQTQSQGDLEMELNTETKGGWEFVGPITYDKLGGGAVLVFRKER
jgi:hypothetical protein